MALRITTTGLLSQNAASFLTLRSSQSLFTKGNPLLPFSKTLHTSKTLYQEDVMKIDTNLKSNQQGTERHMTLPKLSDGTDKIKAKLPEEATEGIDPNSRPFEDWVLFHPVYDRNELNAVKVVHYPEKGMGDWFASSLVKLARFGFDIVSGYRERTPEDFQNLAKKLGKHSVEELTVKEMREARFIMDDKQWMSRILFLESIAGVPGFVASTIRHLNSLRRMKRDGGYIHQLLEEAENERMHLMSFIQIRQPGWFLRLIILGAQGVFYNLFFLSYLISPRICHRFVGKLEEEAVHTYTKCIEQIESGRLPEWENLPAPSIAIDYWRLQPSATLLDMIYAVRADEATHRFVNHSLANLNGGKDYINPFGLREPSAEIRGTKPGFAKEEALEWGAKVMTEVSKRRAKAEAEGRVPHTESPKAKE